MTNSERMLLYGGLAFIAWQLYLQRKCACGPGTMGGECEPPTVSSNQTPLWMQQLAAVYGGGANFVPQCGVWGRCS